MSIRLERLNSQLKKDIATIIIYEMGDPRLGLVSVTGVKVSADLKFAKVAVSIFGKDKTDSIESLKAAAGFIRSKLAHSMKIKTVPELIFELDEGMEHAEKINRIIETLEVGKNEIEGDSK